MKRVDFCYPVLHVTFNAITRFKLNKKPYILSLFFLHEKKNHLNQQFKWINFFLC